MTKPLFPAAQAVYDAVLEICPAPADEIAAAALRAAADCLPIQPLTREPPDQFEMGLSQGQALSRAELIDIATELEQLDD